MGKGAARAKLRRDIEVLRYLDCDGVIGAGQVALQP